MDQLLTKSGRPAIFLLLLPFFFILHGFLVNFPMVPLTEALFLYLKYVLVIILLCGFGFLLIRSWPATAVFVFSVMALHFLFGPIHDGMKALIPQSFLIKYTFLLPFFFLAFILLFFYLRKRKPAFSGLTNYLNLLLLLLIVIDLSQVIYRASRIGSGRNGLPAGFVNCDTCASPDVFLLIADGYAGQQSLRENFHFDNSSFYNELKKRGFYIADSSRSNYNYTPFTVASLLSMDYLQKLEGRNRSLSDRRICYTHINRNPVIDFFRHQGYSFRNFSIFQFAGEPPYRSTNFYKTGIDLVKAPTLLSRIDRDIRFNLVTRFKIPSEIERLTYHQLRGNTDIYERTWKEIAEPSAQPRFFYTHIEMPHYPHYFTAEGKLKPPELLLEDLKVNLDDYLEYLQYANKKYLQLIDHILANSRKPPLIMLMSDHGFREFARDSADHSYHFMNLNSVLLPNKKDPGFYPGVSTVNQFRIIFNKQFGQKLPLVKDSVSFLKE